MQAEAREADINSPRNTVINAFREADLVAWEPGDSAATWRHERVRRGWKKETSIPARGNSICKDNEA